MLVHISDGYTIVCSYAIVGKMYTGCVTCSDRFSALLIMSLSY